MYSVRCPYCPGTQGRCATTSSGRHVTECSSCGRIIEERSSTSHPLFHLRAVDHPLPLATTDLRHLSPKDAVHVDEDPYLPTGFLTTFSTWSLEPTLIYARTASSFSGHLAELERALVDPASSNASWDCGGPQVSVDQLRAYLQIIDVSSILGLDRDIADHAFQLFRDCLSATCLRNRSVEALATAALVQAIREAQEPRTLQEISTASNLPQKEIGKYIKILGEALKLSQPINSNSIAVHMPRFCTLLQLNKSAQELAAHIGEVVVNKCFCTRRNPISISAAAIYLACQLEDKRKTQAEICKVTGLTEVTLRKVYKELLENWDDLLPPTYTPAVPPEKAFPMTSITSGRSSLTKTDLADQDKQQIELKKSSSTSDAMDVDYNVKTKEELESKNNSHESSSVSSFNLQDLNHVPCWQSQVSINAPLQKLDADDHKGDEEVKLIERKSVMSHCEMKGEMEAKDSNSTRRMVQASVVSSSKRYSHLWHFNLPTSMPGSSCETRVNRSGSDADTNQSKDDG